MFVRQYSIKFRDPQDYGQEVTSQNQLQIAEEQVSPPKSIHPYICEVLKEESRYFVFSIIQSGEFSKWSEGNSLTARLSFSSQHGVVFEDCSDPRIKALFEENAKEKVSVVSASQVGGLSFLIKGVKNPPEKIKKQAEADLKKQAEADPKSQKPCYFDAYAMELFKKGIYHQIQVDLKITKCILDGPRNGLLTAALRFPHLLFALSKRFKDSGEMSICLMGPGLWEEKEIPSTCPQFVELFSLFPSANFLLLDNDHHLLEILETQYRKLKTAIYDPTMLKAYLQKQPKGISAPKKYHSLLNSMAREMCGRARNANAMEMVLGKGTVKPLFLNVNPDKIALRDFDFFTSRFNEGEQFDCIVATFSMIHAFSKLSSTTPSHGLPLLGKCLTALKLGGSFYMEFPEIEKFIRNKYGEPGMRAVIDYLESIVGNKLTFEEMPLADFLPNQLNTLANLFSLRIGENQDPKKPMPSATTYSLTAITRTSEKVETKGEKKAEEELVVTLKALLEVKKSKLEDGSQPFRSTLVFS